MRSDARIRYSGFKENEQKKGRVAIAISWDKSCKTGREASHLSPLAGDKRETNPEDLACQSLVTLAFLILLSPPPFALTLTLTFTLACPHHRTRMPFLMASDVLS